MPRVPKRSARSVTQAAHKSAPAVPDGYDTAAAAAELLYSRSPIGVLEVGYRLRRAVHQGRVRAIRAGPKRFMYHRADVLAEAARLTEHLEAKRTEAA